MISDARQQKARITQRLTPVMSPVHVVLRLAAHTPFASILLSGIAIRPIFVSGQGRQKRSCWGAAQLAWLHQLDQDAENFQSALHWAFQQQPTTALNFYGTVAPHW